MHLPLDSTPLRNYRLQGTIGIGNFAKVKLATHLPTTELVAVKVITHGEACSPYYNASRISREVDIMRKLDHSSIVQLYEVGTKQVMEACEKTYLVMEYMKGGDLLSYVSAQQRLSESEACRLFRQLVSGVGYLHGLGVSHRDIKPTNLLLTAHKDLKITDFGLSAEGSIEALETRCGSPCFTAPEIISGTVYDGRKVDIWGMGIVLYIMLVGKLPFEDDSKAGLFRKICAGWYPLPVFLSQKAKELLKRMLVVEAKDRATLAEVRKHAWLAAADLPNRKISRKHTIDYAVFSEAQSLGFSHKELLEGLEMNLKNAATATYHILLNRYIPEECTVKLLRNNHLKRSATPILIRRENTSTRVTPEPLIPSLSPLRSPKPLNRNETLFRRRLGPLPLRSTSRGTCGNKRSLPETQRPTVCSLRRRAHRDITAL